MEEIESAPSPLVGFSGLNDNTIKDLTIKEIEYIVYT
jgi:hypothetical protein